VKKEKDHELDRNSMDYIPTWDEAKIPQKLRMKLENEWEDEIKSKKNEEELDGYIKAWQRKHREKVIKTERAKAEIKTRKLFAHWFATLPEKELIQLIDNSRNIVDPALDKVVETVTATWQLNYIEKLRIRVKRNPIEIEQPSLDKLKRFPSYSPTTGKLTGSPYSFYRMWAHVFRSEARRSGHMSA